MNIGKVVLVRHNGEIKEGIVQEIYNEELEIKLEDGELIRRKYWEIGVVSNPEASE